MRPCPVCYIELKQSHRQNIEIDFCPQCRGVWLDHGELEKLIDLADTVPYQQPPAARQAPPPPQYTQPPQQAPSYQRPPQHQQAYPPNQGYAQHDPYKHDAYKHDPYKQHKHHKKHKHPGAVFLDDFFDIFG